MSKEKNEEQVSAWNPSLVHRKRLGPRVLLYVFLSTWKHEIPALIFNERERRKGTQKTSPRVSVIYNIKTTTPGMCGSLYPVHINKWEKHMTISQDGWFESITHTRRRRHVPSDTFFFLFCFKTQVYSFYLSMLIGEPHQSALRESAACEAPTDNHNNEKKSKIKEALLERSSTNKIKNSDINIRRGRRTKQEREK